MMGAGTSGDSISLKTHSIRIISTFQTYFIFSIQIEHSFEVSISTDNHKMEVNIHSVLPLYDNG